jgi:hypothetical protein
MQHAVVRSQIFRQFADEYLREFETEFEDILGC